MNPIEEVFGCLDNFDMIVTTKCDRSAKDIDGRLLNTTSASVQVKLYNVDGDEIRIELYGKNCSIERIRFYGMKEKAYSVGEDEEAMIYHFRTSRSTVYSLNNVTLQEYLMKIEDQFGVPIMCHGELK